MPGTFGSTLAQCAEIPMARIHENNIGCNHMQCAAQFFQTKGRQGGFANRNSKHGDSNQEEISSRDYTMQALQTRIELNMNKRITEITQKQVARLLPKRPRDSHKGLFGTVAVIGGTNGMVGAPLLAARAALKMGAGSVHVGLLAENAPSVDLLQPELMLHSADDLLRPNPLPVENPSPQSSPAGGRGGERERLSSIPAGEGANVRSMFNPDVFAVGCGLGCDMAAQKLLHAALDSNAALVLDADALNILALRPDLRTLLIAREAACVLTPHPGEAARLLACDTKEIQADRVAAVQKIARTLRCSVVLKGADSLCATRDGRLFVNTTGNPGMSSAGMGDVLTGMIAAFIAQGLTAGNALLLAVHLHGAAGDALAEQNVTVGMTATEVTEWARWLLSKWMS
jgi:ADP-dependent NAD(P)H-hydrate dehydratase / NAD(P)H-hydrate epimerase